MADKEDHRVLADEVQQRYAGHPQREQQAGNAAQGHRARQHHQPRIALERVPAHRVPPSPQEVPHAEAHHQEDREGIQMGRAQPVHHPVPYSAQIEEPNAHEHVVQAEPQWVIHLPQPYTQGREGQDNPGQEPYFLQEMRHDVRQEEREQEPRGRVAVEGARAPDMVPRQGLNRVVVAVEQLGQIGEIDDVAYQSPAEIGHQQSAHTVP